MKRPLALVLVLLMSVGCSKSGAPAPSAPGITLTLASGTPLAAIRQEVAERLEVDRYLFPPLVASPLVFATLHKPDKTIDTPVLLGQVRGEWRGLALTSLAGHRWVYVGLDVPRKRLLGLLDQDEVAKAMPLLGSTDGGQSWAVLAHVPKPAADATLVDFALGPDGKGRITLQVEDEATGGLYHYRTTDAGQTWSAPEREPDTLLEADEPDELATLPDVLRAATRPAK